MTTTPTIDQLVTLDVGDRGVIAPLYDAAYLHHGRSPTEVAAERLLDTIDRGDEVFIVTGFPNPPRFVQETDGPIGAASLARAVSLGLGAHPTIFTGARAIPSVTASARAYGMDVEQVEHGAKHAVRADWTCSLRELPTDTDEARTVANEWLDEHNPAAVLAVELVGANRSGVYHSMAGTDVTAAAPKAAPLFDYADALTIGIGDGGNEVGMGLIEDRVREAVPRAVDCGCGCGEGIAAAVATDVVLPATVSNWGAHALVAALSARLGESLLHPPPLEERALVAAGAAGAIDGASGRTDGTCDGLDPDVHASVVTLLTSLGSPAAY